MLLPDLSATKVEDLYSQAFHIFEYYEVTDPKQIVAALYLSYGADSKMLSEAFNEPASKVYSYAYQVIERLVKLEERITPEEVVGYLQMWTLKVGLQDNFPEDRIYSPDQFQVSRIGILSPREREVLEMATEGHTNRKIAYDLGIVESTVKSHMKTILIKLRCASRVQAATLLEAFKIEEGRKRYRTR